MHHILRCVKKYWKLLVIIVLGLVPLLWFKPGYIIARGDNFPNWFNSINTFHQDTFLWQPLNGGSTSQYPAFLIVAGIWYIFQFIRIPENVIQIILITFNFLGSGLAMYFLASAVYKGQKTTAFIASIFYMFNLFMLTNTPSEGINWTFLFLPLLLGLFIKIVENLENNQSTTKYAVYFIITSTVLFFFSSINPPLLVLSVISLSIMFLYYLFFKPGVRKRLLKNSLALAVLVLLINIWWVIPFYYNFSPDSGSLVPEVVNVITWAWSHSRASFLNLFWLNGVWSWNADYIPYINAYSNSAIILLTFIPMIIAFMGLLFEDRNYKKFNCYIGAVVLSMIFLQKGLHAPFENINLFLYQHIPGFFAFREPVPKFGLILIIFLSLLVGFSANSIMEAIQRVVNIKYKSLVSVAFPLFIIAAFIIVTFPFFTMSETLACKNPCSVYPHSAYVNFPKYWGEASIWINSQDGNFKVLITPNDPFYLSSYKWGFYGGGTALPARLLTKPFLQNQFGYIINNNNAKLLTQLYATIGENKPTEFQRLSTLMKVEFILQRNDIEYIGNNQIISPILLRNFLNNQTNIHLIKVFGELDIYKIDNTYFSPYIYTASNVIMVNGGIDELFQVIDSDNFTQSKPAIFLSNQTELSHWTLIQKHAARIEHYSPKITFQKINPTNYQIKVTNATKPFFLVFSDTYHPQWKAYVNPKNGETNWVKALFQKSVSDDNHFIVNGNANAWYIDPTEWGKDGHGFTITLNYKPQSLFYMGIIISGLTFAVCIGFLVLDMLRRIKRVT